VHTGTLYIVSGPSGVGKTSLVRSLVTSCPNLALSVSCTTRAMRPGEQQGIDYHFYSVEQFRKLEAEGEFLESAEVFGNHYGTSRRWVAGQLEQGSNIVLEIDWQGAAQARAAFPAAISTLVIPPALKTLRARLQQRQQDDESEIDRRMAAATDELSHYREFDYLLVNADFDTAEIELKAIFTAGQLRTPRQTALLGKQLPEIFT